MNVTTLLVLVTIFISISLALPSTSYVKLIDLYLIFNLIIPFVEIILQTILHVLEDEQEEEGQVVMNINGNSTQRTAWKKRMEGGWKIQLRKVLQPATQYGLPGAYLAFIIIFFFVGIIVDNTV